MALRVMVTGASGLLGRAVMKEFCSAGKWEVLGLAFSRSTDKLKKVDLTNEEETSRIVNEFRPRILIHCAAERRPDVVEKNESAAQQLNVEVSERLSKLVDGLNSGSKSSEHSMLYLSTDYVFDGTKPPYKEADCTNPLNKYGKSKLDGERVVQSHLPGAIVLRVPLLYGEVEYVEESSISDLMDTLKNNEKKANISDYEQRYPTSVHDIAVVNELIASRQVELHDMAGVWHWSGPEMMTKYTMCQIMGEVFHLPTDHLVPVRSPKDEALRPFDTALDRSELTNKLGSDINLPNTFFKDGIKDCLAPYV